MIVGIDLGTTNSLIAYFDGASDIPENVKCAMTIGLCGGFTTFSTFAF